ncbi:hypothetical protein CC2G_005383 [Coprinopsis cinerea AmutBmut pab1-1]|nr:hypothetical protein CC2G_005383 [Coprinopsis cinerea AmutBmut pab1-1]
MAPGPNNSGHRHRQFEPAISGHETAMTFTVIFGRRCLSISVHVMTSPTLMEHYEFSFRTSVIRGSLVEDIAEAQVEKGHAQKSWGYTVRRIVLPEDECQIQGPNHAVYIIEPDLQAQALMAGRVSGTDDSFYAEATAVTRGPVWAPYQGFTYLWAMHVPGGAITDDSPQQISSIEAAAAMST